MTWHTKTIKRRQLRCNVAQYHRYIAAVKEAHKDSDEQGMQTFDVALLELYKTGTITLEEAMSHADSRANLEAKINFGG